MKATFDAFRHLAGDALIAAGELVRGRKVRFDGIEPADWPANYDDTFKRHTQHAGWEAPKPLHEYTPAPIPRETVRSALDELADSKLLNIAAHIIAGWKPILLKTTGDLTDVDVLVDALYDRASQFEAVEADVDLPFLAPVQLDAHLTRSAQSASE